MSTVTRSVRLTGWGRTEPTVADVAEPASADEVAALVKGVAGGGGIARGLGRSYNNAAQNDGGRGRPTAPARDLLTVDPHTWGGRPDGLGPREQLNDRLVPAGRAGPRA